MAFLGSLFGEGCMVGPQMPPFGMAGGSLLGGGEEGLLGGMGICQGIIPFRGIFGDDGDKRPTPEQMAMATAIKGRENEIRQDMAKFFKNMKVEMSDAFKKIDVDGDGFLTKDEIKEVMKKNSKTWGHVDDDAFDQVDINDDGKISIDGNFSFSKILQFCFFISSFDFRIFEVEFG